MLVPSPIPYQPLSTLLPKLTPQTSTSLHTSLIGLFISQNDQPLIFTNQICLMSIDIDRKIKGYMLRFYQIENIRLILQVEMYYGFGEKVKKYQNVNNNNHNNNNQLEKNYQQQQQKFNINNDLRLYYFPYTNDLKFGILFSNQKDQQQTLKKIHQYSPKMSQLRQIRNKKLQKLQKIKQKQYFSYHFIRSLNKFIYLITNPFTFPLQQQQKQTLQISQILSVKKTLHLSFDYDNGQIIAQNLNFSQQMKQIFKNIEIKEKINHKNDKDQ